MLRFRDTFALILSYDSGWSLRTAIYPYCMCTPLLKTTYVIQLSTKM